MVDFIPSNLICIVLDRAAQRCFFPPGGHWAITTKCGIDAAAISCIGVEIGLKALQVPEDTKSCTENHILPIHKHDWHEHHLHQPV